MLWFGWEDRQYPTTSSFWLDPTLSDFRTSHIFVREYQKRFPIFSSDKTTAFFCISLFPNIVTRNSSFDFENFIARFLIIGFENFIARFLFSNSCYRFLFEFLVDSVPCDNDLMVLFISWVTPFLHFIPTLFPHGYYHFKPQKQKFI